MTTTTTTLDRDEAIRRIKAALKKRSGKAWSVTGGKGTAWGWISIDTLPRNRTWHFDQTGVDDEGQPVFEYVNDPTRPFGYMGPDDRAELGRLLGLSELADYQGISIPASHDYRQEYVDRAEGRNPSVIGHRY